MRWTTVERGRRPQEHEALATRVRICNQIATILLADGRRLRKTTESLGSAVIPPPHTINPDTPAANDGAAGQPSASA